MLVDILRLPCYNENASLGTSQAKPVDRGSMRREDKERMHRPGLVASGDLGGHGSVAHNRVV